MGGLSGSNMNLPAWLNTKPQTRRYDERWSEKEAYITQSETSLHRKSDTIQNHFRVEHTEISIVLTKALVFRSPKMELQSIKAKKSPIKTATEAGKDTVLSAIRQLIPKQARRMIRIPTGTKTHAARFLFHDRRLT